MDGIAAAGRLNSDEQHMRAVDWDPRGTPLRAFLTEESAKLGVQVGCVDWRQADEVGRLDTDH
jgi:hypothetical protein